MKRLNINDLKRTWSSSDRILISTSTSSLHKRLWWWSALKGWLTTTSSQRWLLDLTHICCTEDAISSALHLESGSPGGQRCVWMLLAQNSTPSSSSWWANWVHLTSAPPSSANGLSHPQTTASERMKHRLHLISTSPTRMCSEPTTVYCSGSPSNYIIKYADDTTVVGLIRDNNDLYYIERQ